ncbi:zinc-dependent metalloprotease [Mucilaginibacter sp. SG564]|uniref:zinc-dependent metalloprotease n=1 Tax=Mucilaginibacter sp. SG564 TaxID=2587022 RepID=UPI0015576F6B|nr:zinc-dependent metalloprotease [Mucilaginibacter sp. SG564]NOW96052.1 hypothetical protein [Mucilaginibacter sp. SG564]
MKKYLILFIILLSFGNAKAQLPFPFGQTKPKTEGDRLDSLLALLNGKKKNTKIRPYQAVITKDAVSEKGLFNVYRVRDSIFFELPDSLFERRVQLIKRLTKGTASKGPAGTIMPGEEIDDKTVYFSFGRNSTIDLYEDVILNLADPKSNIAAAVKNASANPILNSFTIVAIDKKRSVYLVDATSFIKSRTPLNSIGTDATAKAFDLDYVHAYPINVEFGIYCTIGNSAVPIQLNASFIELPKVPMQQRILDRRIGYLSDFAYYYSDDQQKVEKRNFILRWNLQPRQQDVEKWKRGELVQPSKPIVIYIDPNTPKQWVKYLILGINDWQKAFEKAGFKNAIMGKEWPKNDTIHLDDARYSFIDYIPVEKTNAYGPNIHDMRSGEIIQTHIAWYHNVMSLLHNWYLIQEGANDPRARKAKFDDELMGQLIRFVINHEVGHTLGLKHNLGSSSQTPVANLRNKEWLKNHGHTASIMDYARFNYVAQPEDKIPAEYLMPRIGEYDYWAIEWGYKYSGATSAEEDKKISGRWITEKLAKNPRLWFGSMEGENKSSPGWTVDPRMQPEDLGDNNMIANTYGIRNLKRILPNLAKWTQEPGGQYENLNSAYDALTDQFRKYMGQVLVNVGGIERTYKSEDEAGDIYAPVPKAMQEQALAFFGEQLFTTPAWLLDAEVINKIPQDKGDPDFVGDLQVRVLNSLLDTGKLTSISSLNSRFGSQKTFSQSEYIAHIHKMIWDNLATGKPMDFYRRNLQKSYIGALIDIIVTVDPNVTETESYTTARTELIRLRKELESALPKFNNADDRNHIESQLEVLKRAFNEKSSA